MSLLPDDLTIDELRDRIIQPTHAPIWARLNQAWRDAAARQAASEKILFSFACGSSAVTPGVIEAALAWRIANDEKALAYVQAQIDKLERIYADPPESFKQLVGGRTTYFSNVDVCLSVQLCGQAIGQDRIDTVHRLARDYWINDHKGVDPFLYHSAGHNIPFTRVISAARCALAMGQASGHPDWQSVVDLAVDACHLFGRWGFDDRGVSFEASTYGFAVANPLYCFALELERAGGENLFDTLPLLGKLPDAMTMLIFPARDGVPSYSDSHLHVCPNPMHWLLHTAERFNKPQHLALWHEIGGADTGSWQTLLWWDGSSAPPLESFDLPRTFHTPGAALVSSRSSWRRDAVYVNLVGQGRSHSAPGHNHADAGHFSIQAFGEHLAIDSGYWNYNEDQHSVMLIDGQCQTPGGEGWYAMRALGGRLDHVQHHDLLDYALVEAESAKECVWADRHFLFIRMDDHAAYLVVIDNINRDNAAHQYLWQLQARIGCTIDITGETQAVVRGDTARLDCTFLAPLPEDYPTQPHTLTLSHDMKQGAEPESQRLTRPRLLADLHGYNGQLMTLIVPRRNDAAPLQVINQSTRRIFRAQVDCGEITDTIISALDHGYIRHDDVRGNSELAVIRRDRSGKMIHQWTLEGVPLR